MKVFICFENLLPQTPIEMNGKTYSIEDLNKLHGYSINVNKYFKSEEEAITVAFFIWKEEDSKLYFKMWLKADEVNFFEKEILTGELIPVDIRLALDNTDDWSVKRTL